MLTPTNSTIEQNDNSVKQGSGLQRKIETRQARVGVLGLGYVGLPLAIAFAQKGFTVSGFEVDPGRIRSLLSSRSYIADVPDRELRAVIEKRTFTPITDFSRLEAMDVVIVCVPTPLNKNQAIPTFPLSPARQTILHAVFISSSSSFSKVRHTRERRGSSCCRACRSKE